MPNITPHFTLHEFRSQWDNVAYPSKWIKPRLYRLCNNLEVLRSRFGRELGTEVFLEIWSGYRTPAANKHARGSSNSFHMRGMAADFVAYYVAGTKPRRYRIAAPAVHELMLRLIERGNMTQGGVALYRGSGGFVHYDIRGTVARWGAAGPDVKAE